MSTPKRQHWVPRFYLRYFATPDSRGRNERVWIFHRSRGDEAQLTNIANIACENHLYTPLDGDVRDPAMEAKLCRLESSAASFWPSLANERLDLGSIKARRGIALYLAVQALRHPERRDSMAAMRKRAVDLVRDRLHDSNGVPTSQGFRIGERSFELSGAELQEMAAAGPDADTRNWVGLINDEVPVLAEMLMEKRWSVICFKNPDLVTSDYPLYVVSPELQRYQLGGKSAVIMFPISPHRMLTFDDLQAPGNRYFELPEPAADMYNMFTWVNTDAYMISPRESFDVLAGICRVREEYEAELHATDEPTS